MLPGPGRLLPRGGGLANDVWESRHRGIAVILAATVAGLPIFGILRGHGFVHAGADALPASALGLACLAVRGRRWKSSLATLGLAAAVVTYIHVADGVTEAHFLVFVVLGLITLYEDWIPFGLAVAAVTAHHAILGLIAPAEVFGTEAAVRAPVKWALIHGGFVLAATVANLVAWKASENQALKDALSGLPNRRALSAGLDAMVQAGDPVAVLFIDLSGFKKVNDSLGHAAGDQILGEVGRRLAAAVRRPDLVARFGGDEFVVALADATSADAQEVAARLVDVVRAPLAIGGRQLRLSPAVGVACGDSPAEVLVHQADVAMYTAKRLWPQGGYELYTDSMEAGLTTRLALEQDLEFALDRNELVLHYQPIVEMGTGRLVGLEALVRWDHPTRGLVPPGEFVPVAEDTGLIVPIGSWVLHEATAQLAAWQAAHPGLADVYVTVNVSTRQLDQGHLLADVGAALRAAALTPSSLILEITESALVNLNRAGSFNDLVALGVRLALDDFGTGYSSLSYLARLPIDVLKIDKSFTDDIPDGPNEPLLAGILALAHRLGKATVVEGIGDQRQVPALLGLGAAVGQGYLFSRPLPPADATRLVQAEAVRRALSPLTRRPTVLVVEDDDQLARSYTRALAGAGCRTWRASTADEAWDVVRARPPGAVLLDIGLPGADGWSLVERIRADETLRETKIAVVTSDVGRDAASRAAQTGCGYFPKTAIAGRLAEELAAFVG